MFSFKYSDQILIIFHTIIWFKSISSNYMVSMSFKGHRERIIIILTINVDEYIEMLDNFLIPSTEN